MADEEIVVETEVDDIEAIPELEEETVAPESTEPEPEQSVAELDPIVAAWLDEPDEPTPAPAPPPPQEYPQYPQQYPPEQPRGPQFDPNAFAQNPGPYLLNFVQQGNDKMVSDRVNEALTSALPQALGPLADQMGQLQETSRASGARHLGDAKRHIDQAYRNVLSKDNDFRAKGQVYNFVDSQMKETYAGAREAFKRGDYQALVNGVNQMTDPVYPHLVLAMAKTINQHRGGHATPQSLELGKAQVESSKKSPVKSRPKIDASIEEALKVHGKSKEEYWQAMDECGDMVEE